MAGAKIPVIEVEQLTTKKNGRGIIFTDDAANFDVATWTGTSGGADLGGSTFLPAASALAWFRFKSNAGTSYYVPGFNTYW